jgi:chromosome segregation ATPase
MEAVSAKEKNLNELTPTADGRSKRFDSRRAQADDLTKKQLSLETLHERLGQVDDLAKKTTWQMEALRQSRQDLELLRKEVQDFYKSHADITQLHDKLAADRTALEAFGERMTAQSVRAPELEAKMDAIMGKMSLIEEATLEATRLSESVSELDAQISRVGGRLTFVERVESRLDGLNSLNADLDRKLEGQLARRTELETFQSSCDSLGSQIIDSQHKLESVRALQNRLTPLVADLDGLKLGISTAKERLDTVKFDEATVSEQAKHLADLVASSRIAAAEVTERTRQMQTLSEALARTTTIKDELIGELDRVQSRQRDTVGQVQASEDQLARAETMFKQLEQRRTQVAFGEKKLAGVETRLADIKQRADDLDKSIQTIASREQLVNAIKAEVQVVHEIAASTKADLTHVTEHRGDITTLKNRVDELLSRIGETDDRIASIDARRKLIDEVHTKTNTIVHVLDDVRINLETLGEHKAVIDHVAERVNQLEYALQEARNTLRTLQHERELAERIEKSIKQLRAAGKPEDVKKSASAS